MSLLGREQLKHTSLRAAILIFGLALFAGPIQAANAADTVTGLPLYPNIGAPDNTMNFALCHSQVKANLYDLLKGSDAAALTWLTVHLPGFSHMRGTGMGRRQDLFMKTDGTLAVGVTSNPDGVGLYGLSYMHFVPPVAPADQVKLGKFMTRC